MCPCVCVCVCHLVSCFDSWRRRRRARRESRRERVDGGWRGYTVKTHKHKPHAAVQRLPERHVRHTQTQKETAATEANINLCCLGSGQGCDFFTTTCISVEILKMCVCAWECVWLIVICESSSGLRVWLWGKNSPVCQTWLQGDDETTGCISCSHTHRFRCIQL